MTEESHQSRVSISSLALRLRLLGVLPGSGGRAGGEGGCTCTMPSLTMETKRRTNQRDQKIGRSNQNQKISDEVCHLSKTNTSEKNVIPIPLTLPYVLVEEIGSENFVSLWERCVSM